MAQTPARTSRALPLEIHLPSKPRDYRLGDGPALAPIRLSLEDDTGAFIVDKRVLPGEPVNGELKLELYYVVGWPDLPVARVAILATKILDYVSPRTLEDWEYNCSLEKDKEQEKEEIAQKIKQEERVKAHAAATPATGTSTPASGTPRQKRRGRPSKAEVVARQIAQQASFGEDELANVHLPPANTNGPSLSTPQKNRAQAVTYVEETDTNEAISKQLQGGSKSGSDSESQLGEGLGQLDEPGETEKPNPGTTFTSLDSFLPTHSSSGYAEFLIPNLPSTQQDPIQLIPSVPISFMRSNSKNNQLSRRMTQLTTPVPVPSYPRQTGKKTFVPLGKTITPVPAPLLPLARAKLQAQAVSVTPIPAPRYPGSKPEPPKVPHEVKVTPISAPVYSIQRPQMFPYGKPQLQSHRPRIRLWGNRLKTQNLRNHAGLLTPLFLHLFRGNHPRNCIRLLARLYRLPHHFPAMGLQIHTNGHPLATALEIRHLKRRSRLRLRSNLIISAVPLRKVRHRLQKLVTPARKRNRNQKRNKYGK